MVALLISYRIGGRQYISVLTGSGASGGGIFSSGNAAYRTDYRQPRQVITFALDGTDRLPPIEPAKPPVAHSDPSYHADAALEQKGAVAYAMGGCLVCHGWNAVAG